jgi:hypothetical protein
MAKAKDVLRSIRTPIGDIGRLINDPEARREAYLRTRAAATKVRKVVKERIQARRQPAR